MITFQSPTQSFVQFGESGIIENCMWDDLRYCLPVVEDSDIAFQVYVNGTETDIDSICGAYGLPVRIGIVSDCDENDFLLEFTSNPYNDVPELYRLSDTQLLVNWQHGLPGFGTVVGIGECFYIRIQVGDASACSNCLTRSADTCHTSVIDYTNEENYGGFNYCSSGAVPVNDDGSSCEPTIIQFTNVPKVTIPYTQSLKDKYGDAPDVQVWVSDGTNLVNMGISAVFDGYPVNTISVDLGGNGSGIIRIR
jgi:hypothetical protein